MSGERVSAKPPLHPMMAHVHAVSVMNATPRSVRVDNVSDQFAVIRIGEVTVFGAEPRDGLDTLGRSFADKAAIGRAIVARAEQAGHAWRTERRNTQLAAALAATTPTGDRP